MSDCEECGARNAISRDGRTLCLPCWVAVLDRRKPTGVREAVRREREKRERSNRAVALPNQMHFSEFRGEGVRLA